MKEIKCIENNGYNITVGKNYMVLQETPDFYFMVNDNNKTVKYAKQMFELIEEVVVEPEPVKRTEQDMIDSITWDNNKVKFFDLDNNEKFVHYGFDSEEDRANISCGIGDCPGIDNTITYINNAVPKDDDYIDLRKAIFRKIIEKRIINRSAGYECAMRILSTTSNEDSDMLSVLDEMCDLVTEDRNNPNSGNNIRMWVFYTQ